MQETRFKGYFITRYGEVFSNKSGIMKPLKQSHTHNTERKNAKPYVQVGVKGCTLLHRLLADTFINCVDGLTVNHKDGDTLNNSLDNLEVISHQQNCIHAIQTGLVPTGEKHAKAKYSDELLLAALQEVVTGESVKSTAKKYGITQSYLNRVKNKKYRAYLMESFT